MKTSIALICVALVTGACGASQPTPELVSAREAYDRARTSTAAKLAPASVHSAKQALEQAEAAHADDPQSRKEQSFAYVARRRAELAEVHGQIAAARRAQAELAKRYQELQGSMRASAEQQAESLGEQLRDQRTESSARLTATASELQKEREARQAAEERARRALQSLEKVAQVKEEARGTVITLAGGVLFTTGKSELLPTARDSLGQVAKALTEQGVDKNIIVEGHTDSRGSEGDNFRLSEERAESVRSFLISQGVPADRVSSVGRGEAQPLASNDTPEGRANNRRVEIVIGSEQKMGTERQPVPSPTPTP